MIESGDRHFKGVYEDSAGVYKVKQGSADETPYVHEHVHGAYPNQHTWIFYWYNTSGIDEDWC